MLATEQNSDLPSDGAASPETPAISEPAAQPQPVHAPAETWAYNDPMRHIPSIEWMIQKVDVDLRGRVNKLLEPYAALASDDVRRGLIEENLRALGRAVDRIADVAKHGRQAAQHPPAELGAHIEWSVAQAVANLRTVDTVTFGRRFPIQTFERSKAEPLYAALLVALSRLERLTEGIREIDPQVDERLLEKLVNLQEPVDDRMLRPIA